MDRSFPVSPFHLAQMPTDQRELEHTVLVQTRPSDDGMFQVKPLQPYNPCSPAELWAASRSAPQMKFYHCPGDSDLWRAIPEPYEPSSRISCGPDSTYFAPVYMDSHPISIPMISSPTAIGPQSPGLRQEACDGSLERVSDACAPWMGSRSSHSGYHDQLKMEESDSMAHINATPRTSPSPISISSYHSSPQPYSASSPVTVNMKTSASPQTTSDYGGSEDDNHTDPPYSQLIWQALMDQPDRRLPLQKIYEWFEKNTGKGRDQTQKGWQNSIRHNLSMNAGFIAVRDGSPGGKRTMNYWCLTEEAIQNGIQSTTRYRRDIKGRKPSNTTEAPIPNHPEPGRRGERPGRRSKPRSSHQDNRRPTPLHRPETLASCVQPRPITEAGAGAFPQSLPPGYPAPPMDLTGAHWPSNTYVQTFGFNDVISCTTPPHIPDQMHQYGANPSSDGSSFHYQNSGWN
ncbi:hypothetical protein N7468_005184 [Penicillium chermesinum]|uniref:Fork-head domain-containing protein n=1 Tax=Penicillium chermesinum TaxID=63820 RepID=A0A9W9P1C3_9EURO|nr:uncharacterized protein N7468_005184 [Penicillium chermesinum]KAJ5232228.1 hypothetical protein N7468_005184 [Penicillium chermesinum]